MKTVRERSLAADVATMTWTYTHSCPITKKLTVRRDVERLTSPDAMTLEMFPADPKSVKEYRMMRMEFTRGGYPLLLPQVVSGCKKTASDETLGKVSGRKTRGGTARRAAPLATAYTWRRWCRNDGFDSI